MADARKVAANILLKIEKDGAYSNLAVAQLLRESGLEGVDKAFVSALVYGVLDRKLTLDHLLSSFMKTPIKKTAPLTLQVLRIGLYQIMFMDKVPESAAVNESVKIIKKSRESRNAGFVNAVLRNALRTERLLPEGNSPAELSIRYSCPVWIVESFIKDYGLDTAVALLEESLMAPPVTVRVNTLKTDAEGLKRQFEAEGVTACDGSIKGSLHIKNGIDVSGGNSYKKGLFHVQDEASQTVVGILDPKKGERILDICAAPGGKTFTSAIMMENEGQIVACDLYEQRVRLIERSAHRLGIEIIKPMVSDATLFNDELGLFDGILCDVPCSGLGVIRRKPDIKYKPVSDLKELCEIQFAIISNAQKYLRSGGRLLYSTCTLRRAENEELVSRFLAENKGFRKEYEKTFMPHTDKTDGFYCALLIKE